MGNDKMRAYYVNRPPIHLVKKQKKVGGDNQHLIHFGAVSWFLAAFLITPFLGKRIASDDEFRSKFIPKWYDFTIEKPEYAWTRRELHEQYIKLQKEMHERAIAGEFSP